MTNNADEQLASLKSLGSHALFVAGDIASEPDVQRLVDATMDAFGRIDLLVNNAAIFTSVERKNFDDIPVEEWDAVMVTNVRGVWLACSAAVRVMRSQKYGKIVSSS